MVRSVVAVVEIVAVRLVAVSADPMPAGALVDLQQQQSELYGIESPSRDLIRPLKRADPNCQPSYRCASVVMVSKGRTNWRGNYTLQQ